MSSERDLEMEQPGAVEWPEVFERGYIRLGEQGTVMVGAAHAIDLLNEADRRGDLPPQMVDLAGVNRLGQSFSNEYLGSLAFMCSAAGAESLRLINVPDHMRPIIEQTRRRLTAGETIEIVGDSDASETGSGTNAA
jgi:hypothetical protein